MLALLLAAASVPGVSNLLPALPAWTVWSPRAALAPESKNTGAELVLRARAFSSVGAWSAKIAGLKPGATYRFQVACAQERVDSNTSVSAILSWYADEGGTKLLRRDYADPDGPALLARTLEAPAETRLLKVELGLRWSTGSVTFRNPTLTEMPPRQHRRVRLVTTRVRSQPGATVESNLRRLAELLDRAGRERPDLVLMSEIAPQYGVPGTPTELAQRIPGPITEMLAAKARQHHTWVATSMLERDGEEVYNAALLIDREGRIAGKYRKVHLPLAEVESGITPGGDYPVFTTDFGKVGMLICWDNWFPEAARILRVKGAEIMLLPVMGEGSPSHWDIISRARAIDNGMYVVASMDQEWPSRIIDPKGDVLAETTDPFGVAVAEVDLDRQDGVYWMSIGPGLGEPRSLYMRERRPDTYGALEH